MLRLLETEPVREFAIYVLIHRSTPEDSEPRSPIIFIYILGDADSLLNNNQLLQMAQEEETEEERGNAWSTALQPKDNDVDETKGS